MAKCPLCGVDNKPTARFCGTCGTSLPRDPQDAEPPEHNPVVRAGVWLVALFCECFPGLFSLTVLVLSILVGLVGIGIAAFGAVLAMGAPLTGFMIGAFGVITYWSACVWVVSGYVCLPSEGLSVIRGPQWWAFFVVAFGPFLAALAYMGST